MKVYSLETNTVVERKWYLNLLMCMFGLASRLLPNSFYTQLPLLVKSAPEGRNLRSYILIIIQTGNLGPLLYIIWHKIYKNKYDGQLTIFIMIWGIISVFLMAMFHNISHTIFSQPHSAILCILTFAMEIVGCTSSVLFIPSLSQYPQSYLVTYLIGEGFSNVVPNFIAIVQGIITSHTVIMNEQTITEISIKYFFIIMGVIMCASTISYYFLEYSPTGKKGKIKIKPENADVHNNSVNINRFFNDFLLFVLGVLVFFSDGLLLSIQLYSCLPIGCMAYNLAINLSNIVKSLVCFIAFYTNRTSRVVIYVLCIICLVSTIFLLIVAFTSLLPFWYNTTTGTSLIVFVWVLFFGCASYVKMAIAATVEQHEGNNGLFRYGYIRQIGSLLGGIIAYYIIDLEKFLKSYEYC